MKRCLAIGLMLIGATSAGFAQAPNTNPTTSTAAHGPKSSTTTSPRSSATHLGKRGSGIGSKSGSPSATYKSSTRSNSLGGTKSSFNSVGTGRTGSGASTNAHTP